MTDVTSRLAEVRAAIADAAAAAGRNAADVVLVAVTKTFPADDVRTALAAGQRTFGENRVQEAKAKYPPLRDACDDIELHLIGPLQSNKAKDAVRVFDVIQSIDREKVAEAVASAADAAGRMPRVQVQVNIGREPQKAGVDPAGAVALVERCRALGLNVEGLMAIPPVDQPAATHFAALAALAEDLGLNTSMGMSNDFAEAIRHGARWVRVGSAIFGGRPPA